MKHFQIAWAVAVLLLLLPCPRARAQSPTTLFLPEVDAYMRLASNFRLELQGKGAIQDGGFYRATLGPSLEFHVKPVTIAMGYRYLPSGTGPATNRFEPILLLHIPSPGRLLITDKNRADLDWSNGSYKWRYRNRISVQRRVTIHSYHPGPYVSAEFLYESPYSKWASTRLYAGCLLRVTKRLQVDPYYEHENNTGKPPNQQVNAFGLTLSLYFPPHKP